MAASPGPVLSHFKAHLFGCFGGPSAAYQPLGRSIRPSARPTIKPSTAATRANFTTRPITFRTTKTITATIRPRTISSVRMDLIRDVSDLCRHGRVAAVYRAVADGVRGPL